VFSYLTDSQQLAVLGTAYLLPVSIMQGYINLPRLD
jgi:hypothetical protein